MNEKKTPGLKPSAHQEVRGIVLNLALAVPWFFPRAEQMLHEARKTGKFEVRGQPEVDPDSSVYGGVGCVGMVNPMHGEKFENQLKW